MRLKKYFVRKKQKPKKTEDDNPFADSHDDKQGKREGQSFGGYIKNIFAGFGYGMNKRLGELAFHRKYQIHLLLKTKRVTAAVLFLLYSSMALLSFGNFAFFLLFLGTAFLMLDYLWKTRKVPWEKPKE